MECLRGQLQEKPVLLRKNRGISLNLEAFGQKQKGSSDFGPFYC